MHRLRTVYDVVIVGAGPSGCSTAITLAKKGANVLIIDKSFFPRPKLCGGLITEKTLCLLENNLGLLKIKSDMQYESNGFEIYFKRQFLNKVYSNNSIYFISRKILDNRLFKKVQEMGCKTIEGERVTKISNDSLEIGNERIYFNILIGADGANSLVRKKMGLKLNKRKVGFGIQVDVPVDLCPNFHDNLPKIYFGYLKYGWAWVFPKGNYFSIGLGGLKRKKDSMKKSFYDFIRDLGLTDVLDNTHLQGAWIPYGSYLRRPAKSNFYLVGDAAGFVEPITGEGIYFALLSGILAGESICSSNSNKEESYVSKCSERIFVTMRQALISRPFLFTEPLNCIAMKRFSKDKKYMERYMEILSGSLDYKNYFFH